MNMSNNKLYNGKIQVSAIDSTKLPKHIYTSFFNKPYHFYHKLINYLNRRQSEINHFLMVSETYQAHELKLCISIPTKLHHKYLTPKSRSNQTYLTYLNISLIIILNCVNSMLPIDCFLLFCLSKAVNTQD